MKALSCRAGLLRNLGSNSLADRRNAADLCAATSNKQDWLVLLMWTLPQPQLCQHSACTAVCRPAGNLVSSSLAVGRSGHRISSFDRRRQCHCRAARLEELQEATEQYVWTGHDEFDALGDRRDETPLPLPHLEMPKRVVLVRHGQSTWNAEGRVQGSCNLSVLTEKGKSQAHTTKELVSMSLNPTAVRARSA